MKTENKYFTYLPEQVRDIRLELRCVENTAMDEMTKVTDKLGIEWFKGGSEIRGVMMKYILQAYWAGRTAQAQVHHQNECSHDFDYNLHGSVCKLCGFKGCQDSSD
jgi:hypothetical protein